MSSSSSLMSHFDLLFDLLYSGSEMSVTAITQKVSTGFSPNYIFRFFLPISSSRLLMGHIDLLFDLLYCGSKMTVSVITQKVSTGFSPNYIVRFFLPISSSSSLIGHIDLLFDLLYSVSEMSVSAISQTVPTSFSRNYIFTFFLPISSSSSLMGHIDLIDLFYLLCSGPEMFVSMITPKVLKKFSAWFSSNYIFSFFLPISSLSSLVGHIDFQIVNINEVPNHTKSHDVGVNQNRVWMDKRTDMYYTPGVAHFAKITIIPSRRGTLELRVHWFPIGITCDFEKHWFGLFRPTFILATFDMCLLTLQGNALLWSQFGLGWVQRNSNFGSSEHRLWRLFFMWSPVYWSSKHTGKYMYELMI